MEATFAIDRLSFSLLCASKEQQDWFTTTDKERVVVVVVVYSGSNNKSTSNNNNNEGFIENKPSLECLHGVGASSNFVVYFSS